MKYFLGTLVLLSSLAYADIGSNEELLTFAMLTSGEEMGVKRNVSLRGFLLFDEGEFLFCSDMESCYSRGKERVVVKTSNEVNAYLKGVDECHMELSGEFLALSREQSGWPMLGYLYVDNKPKFDFSPNYEVINTRCKAFNVMK